MQIHEKNRSFKVASFFGVSRLSCMFVALVLTVAVSLSAAAQITPGPPALLNTNGTSDDTARDLAPQIATDGAGNWVAVWYSNEDLDGADSDFDIFVSTSTDSGATWTAPALLNTNGTSDLGFDGRPRITTGAGDWIVVWYSTENLGGANGDFDIFVATSTNNGATWTAPILLNTNGIDDTGSDLNPEIATDGAGNWVAVWRSNENLDGTAGTDTDIFVATSTDSGATWTEPSLLNTNGTDDTGVDDLPHITTDGVRNWVAVWHSNEDLNDTAGGDWDIFVARSTNNGATWTAPVLLNTNGTDDTGSDLRPQITTGERRWMAVWSSRENLDGTAGTDQDIFVSTSTNNGVTWTAPALLNSSDTSDPREDNSPQIKTDGAGNWVTVWHSAVDLGGAGNTDFDIFVANSTDSGATWTAPSLLNTNGTADTEHDINVQLETDGLGNWVAVWESKEDLDRTAGTDEDIFVATFIFPSAEASAASGGGGGGCVVATAAYGTPMANDINVLRQVRDTYLLNTAAGTAFVEAYYTFSPPLADFVAKHPAAATTVRVLLTPIIAVASALWTLPLMAGALVMAVGYALRRRKLSLVKANG